MKVSTRGRYGLKAMLDLALHSGEGQVVLKNIAERQDISESYLEQLFSILKKSKLVSSTRGAQGGYLLSKSPEEITVGAILRALEGSFAPVDCVLEENAASCERSETCPTRFIWTKIRDRVNETIDSITLADLVKECRKNECTENDLYYI